jgi:RimJ/RimL family protein N-acetyltransferase
MVKFGFLQMGARRVWAKCRPENVGSFRVLKKAGMQFEEYVLNDKFVRGRLVDSFLCGINREDWLRTRKGDALAASGGRGTDC